MKDKYRYLDCANCDLVGKVAIDKDTYLCGDCYDEYIQLNHKYREYLKSTIRQGK